MQRFAVVTSAQGAIAKERTVTPIRDIYYHHLPSKECLQYVKRTARNNNTKVYALDTSTASLFLDGELWERNICTTTCIVHRHRLGGGGGC